MIYLNKADDGITTSYQQRALWNMAYPQTTKRAYPSVCSLFMCELDTSSVRISNKWMIYRAIPKVLLKTSSRLFILRHSRPLTSKMAFQYPQAYRDEAVVSDGVTRQLA